MEIEAKIKVENLDEMERLLARKGALFKGKEKQEDYFTRQKARKRMSRDQVLSS